MLCPYMVSVRSWAEGWPFLMSSRVMVPGISPTGAPAETIAPTVPDQFATVTDGDRIHSVSASSSVPSESLPWSIISCCQPSWVYQVNVVESGEDE